MTRFLRLYIGWTRSRAARVTLFISLLAMASHWNMTPIGLAALAVCLGLAAASPRLALALVFGATFLPYVYGFPVTAGFVVIAALSPYVAYNFRLFASEAPKQLLGPLAVLFALIAATFPFHKSPDLQFLAFGLIALMEAFVLVKLARLEPKDAWSDLALGFFATFLVPFFCNMTLLLNSPYFVPEHIKSLATYRVTISVIEPNVVAAYLAAAFTACLLTARLRQRTPKFHFGQAILLLSLLAALVASGSRMTLVLAFVVAAGAFCLSSAKIAMREDSPRFCWHSIRLASVSAIVLSIALFGSAAASGKVKLEGLERLFGTSSIEDTGRPKSLRDASDRLDDIPYTGMDVNDYVRRTARHSPHSSLVASAMFLGIWVALPLLFLTLYPIYDALFGYRISEAVPITLALFVLFLGTLTIPATSDRGFLALLGVWFAFARFPQPVRKQALTLQS